MKIILLMVICFATHGTCEPSLQKNTTFGDWDSCMRQGYIDSLQALDLMGNDYVNENKVYVKFYCKEIQKKETHL
jgi:hypothetical protein|tara:strand:- start:750 stop:974 length:225 start_codon:yes stop_codon:yes gene_type:complete